MADDAPSLFDMAADRAREVNGASDEDKLQLYGLFKQATEGACARPRPGVFSPVARRKHDAWKRMAETPPCDARAAYVRLVARLHRGFAAEATAATEAGAP